MPNPEFFDHRSKMIVSAGEFFVIISSISNFFRKASKLLDEIEFGKETFG